MMGKKIHYDCMLLKIAAADSQRQGYFSNRIRTLAFATFNMMKMFSILRVLRVFQQALHNFN